MAELITAPVAFLPDDLAAVREQADNLIGFWAPADLISANLGLDITSLRGRILDVGSGVGLSFEHAVAVETNGQAQVVSYDLTYREDPDETHNTQAFLLNALEERAAEHEYGEGQIQSKVGLIAVAGYAEILPFRAEAFDLTISHSGALTYSPGHPYLASSKHFMSSLAEMVRVTKTGGHIIGAPIIPRNVETIERLAAKQKRQQQITAWKLEEFEPSFSRHETVAHRLIIKK